MTAPVRVAAVLAPLLLLAGAAPPPAGPAARAGGTCIDSTRIVSREVPQPQTLVLGLTGGQRVRSRIDGSCPHLAEIDRGYLLVFDEQQGARICGGDRFRLVDPVAARSGGTAGFPWCRFGPLERLPAQRR